MATNRRVTVVNPWIPGGEGQLRDLFPLPPALFLIIRFLGWLLRHYLLSLLLLSSLLLWTIADWSWWGAFLLFPLLTLSGRLTVTAFYLWYRNPSVPIFARKAG